MSATSGKDRRQCEFCTMWAIMYARTGQGGAALGECRRMPPVVTSANSSGDFPKTEADWWCGEFVRDTEVE
ncbi:MAG: hypothetical protein E6Q97_26720 [Desulfurellales bacterium]|nr:MAG: hypothetical protein E6Q97_26720 [Desulfurellales bacterium]